MTCKAINSDHMSKSKQARKNIENTRWVIVLGFLLRSKNWNEKNYWVNLEFVRSTPPELKPRGWFKWLGSLGGDLSLIEVQSR